MLKVRKPMSGELACIKSGAFLIGLLNPFDADGVAACAKTGVTGFALESLPRISRAQSVSGRMRVMSGAGTVSRQVVNPA